MGKKTERIVVCMSDDDKKTIEKWAWCEGRTPSNFMLQLFKDYERRAKQEGMEVDNVRK